MFASVEYISSNRKRKYDVVKTSSIRNFTKDFKKKKFKIDSDDGMQLEGLIIDTGGEFIQFHFLPLPHTVFQSYFYHECYLFVNFEIYICQNYRKNLLRGCETLPNIEN